MEQLKRLIDKHKDIIAYAFFGICTTLVNIVAYWLCAHISQFGVIPSAIIAWIVAVLFAYVTNRKWVFYSEAVGVKSIVKEIASFFCCRATTGVLDWTIMYVFVERMHLNDVSIKFLANVVVIVLNYIASKFVIFKKDNNLINN